MLKHKKARQKGKFSFTRYFQKFQPGESVAVVIELSHPFSYPKRIQGRTGKVIEKRGSAYYVEIKDLKMAKKYLIKPVHLKKILTK
jgi:large subunit ribosomal protein L21e